MEKNVQNRLIPFGTVSGYGASNNPQWLQKSHSELYGASEQS